MSAARCSASGVRLLYHNHDWEFDNGSRVINAVLREMRHEREATIEDIVVDEVIDEPDETIH